MLREKLLNDANAYVAHYFHAGTWWCRASGQAWTEVSTSTSTELLIFEYALLVIRLRICGRSIEEDMPRNHGSFPRDIEILRRTDKEYRKP